MEAFVTHLLHALGQLIALIRNPGPLIEVGGYPALGAVIFLETGALVFFLPGDSLLVVAGVYAAKGDLNIGTLNLLLGPLAVAGDACSYLIGKRLGPMLFNQQKARLLRPEHLKAAQNFYTQHGGRAIVLARFVPVVRTFVPVVAGAASMGYRDFVTYNIVGGLAWVGSMTLSGYFLGARFPALTQHMDLVLVSVVAISLLPIIWESVKAKMAAKHSR